MCRTLIWIYQQTATRLLLMCSWAKHLRLEYLPSRGSNERLLSGGSTSCTDSWTCVDYTLHFLCGELISPFNSEASSSFPQAGRGRIFNLPVTATKQSWHKVHSWELSEAFCSIPQPSSIFMSGISCQGDGSVVGTQYLLWLHPLSTEKHWSSFLTLEIVR